MSLRARLVLGAVFGLTSSITVIVAANATWRTVAPAGIEVRAGDDEIILQTNRDIKGTMQDSSLPLFAIVGAIASGLAFLLGPKPRLGASAILGAFGLMAAASAAISRGIRTVPAEWLGANPIDRVSFSAPTAAPSIAVAGGIGMIAAAVWLLTAARRAPKLSMPEGAPEGGERRRDEPIPPQDEGVWE